MNDRGLTEIFQKHAGAYFKDIEAEFAPMRDVKVTWMRTTTEVHFGVSDYLEGAPEEALDELAQNILNRIANGGGNLLPAKIAEYVNTKAFSGAYQNTYIDRNRFSKEPTEELEELRQLLKDNGLWPEGFDDLVLVWAPARLEEDELAEEPAPHCSVLMRVVSVPGEWQGALNACPSYQKKVYEMLCHVFAGYGANIKVYQSLVRKWRD